MALDATLVKIKDWIEESYPRPKTDPDWVKACVEFLVNELQLDPSRQFDELADQVHLQLLQSDLADSMIGQPGIGIPETIDSMKNGVVGTPADGGPILVQIASLTEIGASAFTLTNVRQARLDKADMTGLTVAKDDANDKESEANEDDANKRRDLPEEDATMPKYPRSMLSMFLSDGTVSVKAIEFKKLPELVLGETPLGCKLLLKGVRIRNGIALLEPANVEVLGYQSDDLVATQDIEFLRSLRRRLGKSEEDLEEYAPASEQDRPVADNQAQARVQTRPRSNAQAPQNDEEIPANPPDSPLESRAQDQHDERSERLSNYSFDEPSGMDEDFWREIDRAEEEVLRRPSPPQPQPPPPTGTRTTTRVTENSGGNIVTNAGHNQRRGNSTTASSRPRGDIIELDGSDDSDEEPVLPPPRRKVAKYVPTDTIDLSD